MSQSSDPSSSRHEAPTERVMEWHDGLRVAKRFVLQRMLGRGAQGVVWLAQDELLQTNVALKRFAPHFAWLAPHEIERIRSEVVRVRAISHPGVVRLHDLLSLTDGLVLVMEWIDGESLADRIRRDGPLAPTEILSWLPGLCEALAHVHQTAHLVHRDIKPGNILIDRDGHAHLCDFGVAAPLAESLARVSGLTLPGTLAYMSPQQLYGADPAPADDIYSMGALLYECLTGEPPFTQGHLPAQVERITPEGLTARRRRKGLPAATWEKHWERLLRRCLDKSADQRPQSADQLLALATGREPLAPRSQRRRHAGLAGLLVASVAALTSPLWFARESISSPGSDRPPAAQPTNTPDSDDAASTDWRDYRRKPASHWSGVIADSLVLHVPMGQQWTDQSGFGHRATYLPGDTADPWGNADGACAFDGQTRWQVPAHPAFAVGSNDPWTLALWLRLDTTEGTIFQLQPDLPSALALELNIRDGVLHVDWLSSHIEDRASFAADRSLADNAWHHVLVSRSRDGLLLEIDGVEAGSFPLDMLPDIPAGTNASLSLGRIASQRSRAQAQFAVDEVHFLRAALSAEARRSLYLRNPTPTAPGLRNFFQTARRYRFLNQSFEDADSLRAKIAADFGPQARIATWEELKAHFGLSGELFARLLGAPPSGTWHVTYRGQPEFTPGRLVRIQRRDNSISPRYLSHDEFPDRSFVLGSWLTANGAIFVPPEAHAIETSSFLSFEPGSAAWPAADTETRWNVHHNFPALAIGLGFEIASRTEAGVLSLRWQEAEASDPALALKLVRREDLPSNVELSVVGRDQAPTKRVLNLNSAEQHLWLVAHSDQVTLVMVQASDQTALLSWELALDQTLPLGPGSLVWKQTGNGLTPHWLEAGSL